MTLSVGFDSSKCPKDAVLQWLKVQTPLSWCGFYLAPAPNHSNTSWMSQLSALRAAGWGIAPLYVGQQTVSSCATCAQNTMTEAQGTSDGADAASLATTAGFAPGSFIYLDIEQGGTLGDDILAYAQAWAVSLVSNGFKVGFYCSYKNSAAQLKAGAQANVLTSDCRIWDWNVQDCPGDVKSIPIKDPTLSGFAGADMWQFAQGCSISLDDGSTFSPIDFSYSDMADPSSGA